MHGLVVAALCLSLGVHWALLQSLAWTGMLLSWSQEVSLVEAVKNTFDGEHPCPLCKAVESGQQQAPKSAPLERIKLDAVLAAAVRLVPPPAIPLIHADWRATPAEGHPETQHRPPRSGPALLV
jgi:hypothetical protein